MNIYVDHINIRHPSKDLQQRMRFKRNYPERWKANYFHKKSINFVSLVTDYLVDTSFNALNKRAEPRLVHIAGLCLPVLFCLCTRTSLHPARFFMRLYVWFRSKDGSISSLNVECVKLQIFLRVLTRTLSPSFTMICRCRNARCHLAVLFHVAVKSFFVFFKTKKKRFKAGFLW